MDVEKQTPLPDASGPVPTREPTHGKTTGASDSEDALTLFDPAVILEKYEHETVDAYVIAPEDWDVAADNPRNWPNSKRWKNALLISITGFLS